MDEGTARVSREATAFASLTSPKLSSRLSFRLLTCISSLPATAAFLDVCDVKIQGTKRVSMGMAWLAQEQGQQGRISKHAIPVPPLLLLLYLATRQTLGS